MTSALAKNTSSKAPPLSTISPRLNANKPLKSGLFVLEAELLGQPAITNSS
jgi:hypothetical protein